MATGACSPVCSCIQPSSLLLPTVRPVWAACMFRLMCVQNCPLPTSWHFMGENGSCMPRARHLFSWILCSAWHGSRAPYHLESQNPSMMPGPALPLTSWAWERAWNLPGPVHSFRQGVSILLLDGRRVFRPVKNCHILSRKAFEF